MALLLLMMALAYGFTGRATALVNHDLMPFAPLRAKLIARYGPHSYPARFISCPWCVSMWIALPAALAVWWAARGAHLHTGPGWLFVPGLWFSISWAVSLTAINLDDDDTDDESYGDGQP